MSVTANRAAAATAAADPETISVGYVAGEVLAVLRRNAVPFGILGLLFTLPGVVLDAVFGSAAAAGPAATIDATTLLLAGVGLMATLLLLGAVSYGVFNDQRGAPAAIGACLGRGLLCAVAAVPAAVLVALVLYAGAVLLLVPGAIAAVLLYVAVPVQVVERPGTRAALRRSLALTRGNRLAIGGLVAVALLVAGAGSVLTEFVAHGVFGGALGFIVQWLIAAATGLYWSALAAVAYYELRDATTGPDIQALTAVFD